MFHARDVNQQVGELVRRARRAKGITQIELSRTTKIGRASIANIEIGIQSITVYQLLMLAAGLNVQPIDLIPSLSSFSDSDEEARRLEATYRKVLSIEDNALKHAASSAEWVGVIRS